MFALLHSSKQSGPRSDLDALLVRMRQRLYPETIPVLASYWLKTVYAGGHERGWWRELNGHLKEVLRAQPLDTPSRDALIEIQNWIQRRGLSDGKTSSPPPPRLEPFRPNLRPEWLAPYMGRLLNEWLSAEIASLLVDESELAVAPDAGIPVLAVGRALERLLVRERFSPETLEQFLQPGLLSPQYAYPADAEILRDVVLALLGWTAAPPSPVMPAAVIGVAAGAPLLGSLRDAVRDASLVQCGGGDEIHVPVGSQALEVLKRVPPPLASVIVTMDGRWWKSQYFDIGDRHSAVYRPGGRLRIDYSTEHARLVVPWPETQLCWDGHVHIPDSFEIFGREWHTSSWETDGEGTSLHLVFSRVLPITEIRPEADTGFRRSHPASVDIAWTALENALAASLAQKSREPVEHLSRSEFIPLGRALLGLVEAVNSLRLSKRETLEKQLRAVRYLQAEVSQAYGRVPWRILPGAIRATFLKKRRDPALLELVNEVFDGIPEAVERSTSPSRAA
jgi:hypothetical protein